MACTFGLLSYQEDIGSGKETSICLVCNLLTVDFDDFVEEALEVVAAGLFAVDDLELGWEVRQGEVDVLEIHVDDFMKRLKFAVPLHTAGH